jgi:protein TonB
LNTAVQASIADRLGSTIFLAALGHGVVILGITFTSNPLPESPELPSINVTLLVDSREAERTAADTAMLAQRNQSGGGQVDEGKRATTTLAAQQTLSQLGDPLGADLEDGTPREQAIRDDRLLTNRESEDALRADPQANENPDTMPKKAAALLERDVQQTLVSEIDLKAELPSDEAESDLASPSTRASELAEYLVGWRRRVEQIGTANFPARFLAPNANLGRPTLEVAIGADGRLEDIVVRRSSGDSTLDQAALKILRLAAPFEPLPEIILAEHNVLRFAYEWDFSNSEDELSVAARD